MISRLVVLIVFYMGGSVHILLDRGSCLIEWLGLYFYCSIELEWYGYCKSFHMVRWWEVMNYIYHYVSSISSHHRYDYSRQYQLCNLIRLQFFFLYFLWEYIYQSRQKQEVRISISTRDYLYNLLPRLLFWKITLVYALSRERKDGRYTYDWMVKGEIIWEA